jgi:hypothetical protein
MPGGWWALTLHLMTRRRSHHSIFKAHCPPSLPLTRGTNRPDNLDELAPSPDQNVPTSRNVQTLPPTRLRDRPLPCKRFYAGGVVATLTAIRRPSTTFGQATSHAVDESGEEGSQGGRSPVNSTRRITRASSPAETGGTDLPPQNSERVDGMKSNTTPIRRPTDS